MVRVRGKKLSRKAGLGIANFREQLHKRDTKGQFADKPGAGNDAPQQGSQKSADKPDVTEKFDEARWRKAPGIKKLSDVEQLRDPSFDNKNDEVMFKVKSEAGDLEAIFEKTGMKFIDGNESEEVDFYTGNEFNSTLRAKGVLDEEEQGVVTALDKIFEDSATATDLVTYRGVQDFATTLRDAPAGKIFTDDGYTSTTMNPWFASYFTSYEAPTVLRVHIPKGHPAALIGRAGGEGSSSRALNDAAEVLLPRGSKYRVVGRSEEQVDYASELGQDDPSRGRRMKILDVEILW